MNDRLAQDLWDWEEGRLGSDELVSRHPNEDIGGLLALHGTLASVPSDVDADRVWATIASRLSDHPLPFLKRLAAWLKRPVIALAASTLMGTGVAYAADVGPVRDGVDKVLGGIVRVFGGDDSRDQEPRKDTDRDPGGVPQGSASPSGDDSDDHGSGSGSDDSKDDSGEGSDDRDGDDDAGSGSDDGSDSDDESDDGSDDSSGSGSDDEPDGDDDSPGKGSDHDDDQRDDPDDESDDDSSDGSSHDEDEIDGGGHDVDLEDLIDDETDAGDSGGDDD